MNEELIQKTEEVQASRPWVKYLVTAGIGLLAVLLVLLSRGFFKDGVTAADRIMLLSDAFFTVGILIACFGGLMYVSGEGVFDGPSRLGDNDKAVILKEKIKAFEEEFIAEFGSIRCPEILGGLDPSVQADRPAIIEQDLFRRTCSDAVCFAVELVSEMLEED